MSGASGRRLSVLLLGINYAPEGSGVAPYTSGVARGLSERGHRVEVVTAFPHYPEWRVRPGYAGWSAVEHIDGVRVRRVRHYVPHAPRNHRRAVSEVTFGARLLATRWSRPDVVVCVSPALISTAMAMVRGTRSRAAVGVVVQDLYSAGLAQLGVAAGRGGPLMSRLEKAVLGRADGVAVIHDRFKSRLVEDLAISEDKVSVIRNWVHLPAVPEFDRALFRGEMGWGREHFIVLHTGAMGDKQALGNVVEAARLADARGADAMFVLVGHGRYRSELERQARGVGRIRFLDPMPDSQYGKALRAADVLLVNEKPGVRDMAVPSKLTSYFSAGAPVVAATDAGSATADEILASGGGIRVSAGHPALMLDAVTSLQRDPSRAQGLAQSGLRYSNRVLSERAAIDSYETWINRLILQPRRTSDGPRR